MRPRDGRGRGRRVPRVRLLDGGAYLRPPNAKVDAIVDAVFASSTEARICGNARSVVDNPTAQEGVRLLDGGAYLRQRLLSVGEGLLGRCSSPRGRRVLRQGSRRRLLQRTQAVFACSAEARTCGQVLDECAPGLRPWCSSRARRRVFAASVRMHRRHAARSVVRPSLRLHNCPDATTPQPPPRTAARRDAGRARRARCPRCSSGSTSARARCGRARPARRRS